jgi:hypothetical protein
MRNASVTKDSTLARRYTHRCHDTYCYRYKYEYWRRSMVKAGNGRGIPQRRKILTVCYMNKTLKMKASLIGLPIREASNYQQVIY